jgi:hypothetical protein
MCLIHIDESATRVDSCMTVTFCISFFEKLDSLLDRLGNRRMMHDSRNNTLEWVHRNQNDTITIVVRRFTSYKYLIRLALITISEFFFLSFLPRVHLPCPFTRNQWKTREAPSALALPPKRGVHRQTVLKLHYQDPPDHHRH